VHVDQSLPRQAAQPQEEWDRCLLRILGEAAGQVEERFLENVGRVNAAVQPPIEAQANHLPQPQPVAQ
jgi:hypothetical protein